MQQALESLSKDSQSGESKASNEVALKLFDLKHQQLQETLKELRGCWEKKKEKEKEKEKKEKEMTREVQVKFRFAKELCHSFFQVVSASKVKLPKKDYGYGYKLALLEPSLELAGGKTRRFLFKATNIPSGCCILGGLPQSHSGQGTIPVE